MSNVTLFDPRCRQDAPFSIDVIMREYLMSCFSLTLLPDVYFLNTKCVLGQLSNIKLLSLDIFVVDSVDSKDMNYLT